jgi:hypothetical protein
MLNIYTVTCLACSQCVHYQLRLGSTALCSYLGFTLIDACLLRRSRSASRGLRQPAEADTGSEDRSTLYVYLENLSTQRSTR